MKLKEEVQKQFGEVSYETKEITNENGGRRELTCVENWARLLNNQDYIKRLTPLHIAQNDNLVLFRYTDHVSIKEGEKEINSFDEEFWNI